MDISSTADAWKVLDKTLRAIDEGKVKDCTADIDALLTFAGLYSGILTAFLIESYRNLSPDPQQVTAEVLQDIQLQMKSFVLNSGFLNSTAVIPAPSLFRPRTTDIRVNVCWFSSLVLSLSTASFAILVKQWLREYLAIDRTVPQERIRIRHFRYRGLEAWKLFEIAACLLLLLQLSLADFFVGLCFFTIEVHPAIGQATTTLVSGWAFFFVFAVFAPILSAHCPYKTKFLNVLLQRIRHRLRKGVLLSDQASTGSRSYSLLDRARAFLSWFSGTGTPREGPHITQSQEEFDVVEMQPDGVGAEWIISHCLMSEEYFLDETIAAREEEEICRMEQHDIVIFKKVDSILSDDTLLETMRDAIQRRPPVHGMVLRLVINAIRHRLGMPQQGTKSQHTQNYNLDIISPAARISFINILADSLLHALSSMPSTVVDQWRSQKEAKKWMDDTLLLIIGLLPLDSPIPDTLTSLYQQLLRATPGDDHAGSALLAERIITTACGKRTTDAWRVLAFASIAEALKVCEPISLSRIVHRCYPAPHGIQNLGETNSLAHQCHILTHHDVTGRILLVLLQLASVVLYEVAKVSQDAPSKAGGETMPPEVIELLDFVVKAVPRIEEQRPDLEEQHLDVEIDLTQPSIPGGVGLDKLFLVYFTTPSLVYPFFECLGSHPEVLSTNISRQILHNPLSRIQKPHNLSSDAHAGILYACAEYCRARQRSSNFNLVSALRLCHFVICFHTDDELVKEKWLEVFREIKDSMTAIYESSSQDGIEYNQFQEASEVAHLILQTIDSDLEDGKKMYRIGRPDNPHSNLLRPVSMEDEIDETTRYTRWSKQFDASSSPYHDDFIELVRHISTRTRDNHGRIFWRVRRLDEIRTETATSS